MSNRRKESEQVESVRGRRKPQARALIAASIPRGAKKAGTVRGREVNSCDHERNR
jgi:hypothetical protein